MRHRPVKLRLPGVMVDPNAGTIRDAVEIPESCLAGDNAKVQRRVLGGLFAFGASRKVGT